MSETEQQRDKLAILSLRLAEAIRRQLAEAARSEDRSLNSEIVHRLKKSLASEGAAA